MQSAPIPYASALMTDAPDEIRARGYATNEEMTAIARVGRETLTKWVREKLLPKPKVTSFGKGTVSLWSLEAVERAQFIVAKRAQFHTMEEVKEMVLKRWPPNPSPPEAG